MRSWTKYGALVCGFFFCCTVSLAAEPALTLKPGDRVVYLGNTLGDRMQHAGWLETYIHALHPEHELVFRNLAFPGDELTVRYREDNFGSPDQWLAKVQANVIFSFFGYNEALRGEGHLSQFREDLAKTIEGMRAQKYDGRSSPQLVFFSPIAHENLKDPNLPDGSENNVKLAAITKAMASVCKEKDVLFVDLFTPSQQLYSQASRPLTMNGIHLLDQGDQAIAEVIIRALFPGASLSKDEKKLEFLREAVLEKNDYWFNRYRVVDGYNVFGGRSKLAWFGQSNADVMMREMEIFDVMTANRDVKVWARARGGDHVVRDDNLPSELDVKTNIPGPIDDGKHVYLGGEEAIGKMRIAQGMQVNLFASEEMFPDLINPVQMAVDTDGRLFVAVWPSYPHWNPTEPRRDKILCFPDDNGDGVADRSVVFADNLNSVTGFEFWGGGMLVAALPEIWFLKDSDNDGRADVRIRMLQGVSSADTHHSANAMLVGPDGWLYWSRGIFNTASMETPTKTFRGEASGVYRFNPRTYEVEFHFPIGPNPHGDVFDQWGYQFANDGTSGTGSYVNLGKGIGNKQWFKMRVRPVAATGILSSSHFPEANQGNFLICNCIGFLGVLQHQVKYNGADITAEEIEPILVSTDPNFRPSDIEVGGDGALYVADWSNAIIGHMQHNMRDPNRDNQHGRIYRVTAKDRPLVKPVKLKGQPIAEVCETFFAKENSARYRARLELSGRATAEVVSKVGAWAAKLDPAAPDQAQALLECLWVFAEHRVPNVELVRKVFAAQEPRVRAAAVRTLGQWAGRVKNVEDFIVAAAGDDAALVRAEAVKAAVEFGGELAAEVVYRVALQPLDAELETVLRYGRERSDADGRLQRAIAEKTPLSEAALAYALKFASVESLSQLPQGEKVYEAILGRADASAPMLSEALQGIAKLRGESSLPTLLQLIKQRDQEGQVAAVGILRQLLLDVPADQLRPLRGMLKEMAEKSQQAEARQAGFAAWMLADRSVDTAMATAAESEDRLADFLRGTQAIAGGPLKEKLFAAIRPLMFELPPTITDRSVSASLGQSGIEVDFFFPAPGNVAKETLDGLQAKESGIVPRIEMNVPQRLADDGFALRFSGTLLVPTAGTYEFFVASDDGSRIYVDDQLVVDNDRLQGMTERNGKIDLIAGPHSILVTYFDNGGGDGLAVNWKGPGFEKQPIAEDRLVVGGRGESITDLAVRAIAAIPGFDAEKFNDWTRLVKADRSRVAAIAALRGLPPESWDARELPGLVDNLIEMVSSIPAKFRTGGSAQEAVELVRAFAGKLPPAEGAKILERLENLDVRVIAIGTVVERMIYDKEQIVVQAGKPVEFRFANTDNMPHNFVIVQPGALEEVGLKGEATALEENAKDRNFVPVSDKILLASRLLNSGESQTLSFEVPAEPGMYPYVCTYPGHWRRMFGVLVVVEDLDQYNADPSAYLAAHPVDVKDAMLATIGRDVEWKFEDLVGDLKGLKQGRSFEVGRNLFRAANCVGCHKLGDEGRAYGPDLAMLEPRKGTAEAILKSILYPSEEIDVKYQSQMFVMDSGAVVKGMVIEETDAEVKVLVDPLAKAEPISLIKEEVEDRKKVEVSAMPQGLLAKLTREEILDLIAFVMAKGDAKSEFYGDHAHGDHGHEH